LIVSGFGFDHIQDKELPFIFFKICIFVADAMTPTSIIVFAGMQFDFG